MSELVTDVSAVAFVAPARRWTAGGRRRRRPPLLVALAGVVGAVVAVAPIWYLVDRALERGWSATVDELWQRRTFDLVVRSVTLAAAVTAASVVIGVFAAWTVVRSDLRGRGVLRVLFALPLAIPSYLSAFAWVSWDQDLAGFWGATLVLTMVSYPFVYLPTVAALRHLDPAQEEVARSLGRSRLVRRDRAHAAPDPHLHHSRSAARRAVRPQRLRRRRSDALRGVHVGDLRLVPIGLQPDACRGARPSAGRDRPRPRCRRGAGAWPCDSGAAGCGSAEAARSGAARSCGAGRMAAVGRSARRRRRVPVYRVVYWVTTFSSPDVDLADVTRTLGETLTWRALAAVATLLLAVPVGVLAARFRSAASSTIERSTYIAHALPGIVVAISLVYIGVRVLRPIYLETPLLVLGYVVLFLPLAVGAVRASIEQSPLRLEEVARSLGATSRGVLVRVTAPLAMPGITAGAALVFLSTMKELPVTLVLHPTGTDTLATTLWRFTSVSDYANAGPYALALVVFAAIPTALLTGVLFARRDARVQEATAR